MLDVFLSDSPTMDSQQNYLFTVKPVFKGHRMNTDKTGLCLHVTFMQRVIYPYAKFINADLLNTVKSR